VFHWPILLLFADAAHVVNVGVAFSTCKNPIVNQWQEITIKDNFQIKKIKKYKIFTSKIDFA
jgi:hypothetical protein